MGHYVLWADAERKADGFAYRFVRGVSAQGRDGDGGPTAPPERAAPGASAAARAGGRR